MKAFIKRMLLQGYAWKENDRNSKVFYYHDIHRGESAVTEMSTPVTLFKKHLEVLEQEGFKVVKNIENPEYEVMITFDDGFTGLYENFDLFKEYNIPVTLFVIAGRIGKERYLNEEQLKMLYESGLVQMGSHTVGHKNLDELALEETNDELVCSKEILEEILGATVDTLCYPRGRFNEQIAALAKEAGYARQFSCLPGNYQDEVFPGVIRRNFVQHAAPDEFKAWLYGGGKVFDKRFRQMHIREQS